jgi:hypothetical protein
MKLDYNVKKELVEEDDRLRPKMAKTKEQHGEEAARHLFCSDPSLEMAQEKSELSSLKNPPIVTSQMAGVPRPMIDGDHLYLIILRG